MRIRTLSLSSHININQCKVSPSPFCPPSTERVEQNTTTVVQVCVKKSVRSKFESNKFRMSRLRIPYVSICREKKERIVNPSSASCTANNDRGFFRHNSIKRWSDYTLQNWLRLGSSHQLGIPHIFSTKHRFLCKLKTACTLCTLIATNIREHPLLGSVPLLYSL